jgi:hypothetical protein
LSVNAVTSAPSLIPVDTGSANLSTVHSTKVLDAFVLEAEDRTGVSSGARIVRTSVKSSRLETADPGPVKGVFVGVKLSENDIIFSF